MQSSDKQTEARVVAVNGPILETSGLECAIGDLLLAARPGAEPVRAQVVGFRDSRRFAVVFDDPYGLEAGSTVSSAGPLRVPVGVALKGRVLDALGQPVDEPLPFEIESSYPSHGHPPHFLTRPEVTEILPTGLRVIDSLLTVGKGQRMGFFANSGVGKRTTLAMVARGGGADIVVFCLVGEDWREVRGFLESDLQSKGRARSVVVVAGPEEPAAARVQAVLTATTVAEFFRDQGQHVLLVIDSVTTFLAAQRELALARGELPDSRATHLGGLPGWVKRLGTSQHGTITALLVAHLEGKNYTEEPLPYALSKIVDGQLVLTRARAHAGVYPAVDVMQSVSRDFCRVNSSEHVQAAGKLRGLLALYEEYRERAESGLYQPGSEPSVDQALSHFESVRAFLCQGVFEECGFEECSRRLRQLSSDEASG